MRMCPHCHTEMLENCWLHTSVERRRLEVRSDRHILLENSAPLQAAVCPKCGQVSLFIDEPEAFVQKAAQAEPDFF